MEKNSVPSSLERKQFETFFRSEVIPGFLNKRFTGSSMYNNLKHCFLSFLKRDISFDRNNVFNWIRSNEDGA